VLRRIARISLLLFALLLRLLYRQQQQNGTHKMKEGSNRRSRPATSKVSGGRSVAIAIGIFEKDGRYTM
jgi:hypothetical protein